MRKHLNGWRGLVVAVVLFLIAGGTAWSASGDYAAWGRAGAEVWRITSSGHLVPGSNATRDLGTSSVKVRNAYVENITIAGTYSVDDLGATDDLTVGDDATITGDTQVNGTITVGGAAVFNTTLNTTGLATLDNATVNGTIGTATFTASSTANVTGLTTVNNATVNATKTLSALGPVVLGRETVSANATITATCSTVVAITDLSGNITVSFNAPPAGVHHIIVDESGKLGIAGNVTVNVTSGTINGLNNITLTNTTATDGAGGSNVTAYRFHATSTTAGFLYR